jgi:uncharacterized protein with PIN domain/mRNA deadenylase 3'-5' endonuclease subunit Ccr4
MKQNKQKRRKAKRKNNKNAPLPPPATIRPSWVDQVAFVPVTTNKSSTPVTATTAATTSTSSTALAATSSSPSSSQQQVSVSIVSWNVLAQTYCTRRSHPQLPHAAAKVVFLPSKRKKRILQVLEQLAAAAATTTTTANKEQEAQEEEDVTSDDGSRSRSSENDVGGHDDDNGCGGVDIFCLQEVDLPEVGKHLATLGYVGVETPRIAGGGSGGRADSCVVYANSKRGWHVLENEIIRLDDLATVSSTTSSTGSSSSSSTNFQGLQTSFLRRNAAMLVRLQYIPPTPTSSSSGIAAAATPTTTIVVANAHLYWHPGYEYVKLCQVHYILQRARAFLRTIHGGKREEPLILCGDLNSKPRGCCHSYLTRGYINAKLVAPWYSSTSNNIVDVEEDDEDDEESGNKDENNDVDKDNNSDEKLAEEEMSKLSIRDQAKSNRPPSAASAEAVAATGEQEAAEEEAGPPEIRYLLDVTLNRLCRWLRILGIDTALETEQEEQQRTSTVITKGSRQSSRVNVAAAATTTTSSASDQAPVTESTGTFNETPDSTATTNANATTTANGNSSQFNLYSSRRVLLFDRCLEEGRTLVTTSIRLSQRNDCPPGTYCIHPTSLGNLEVVMVHLLKTHGVVLDPVNKFLSRCVVCNGNINSVGDDLGEKRRILESYDAPLEKLMDANVYECDGCKQGYWWSEDVETYSASRVKDTAKKLLLKCLAGGIPLVQDKDYTTGTAAGGDTTIVRKYDLGILNGKGINVDAVRRQGWDYTEPGSEVLRQELDVIEWLKKEQLACPFQLESAYSRGSKSITGVIVDSNDANDDDGPAGFGADQDGNDDDGGELLPFTNVTAHFVNTLDYIFYERQMFVLLERLFVPTSFRQMNPEAIHNGHLLPSDVWPSDHVAIGARLLLLAPPEQEEDPDQQLEPGEAVPKESDSMTVQNDDTPIAASGQVNDVSANTTVTTPVAPAHLPSRTHPPYHRRPPPPPPPPTPPILTWNNLKSVEHMTVPSYDNDDTFNDADYDMMFCAPVAATAGDANVGQQLNGNISNIPVDPPAEAPPPPPPLSTAVVAPLAVNHGQRCDCGCVPPIRSMFEMAELRKQYRKKKGLEKRAAAAIDSL